MYMCLVQYYMYMYNNTCTVHVFSIQYYMYMYNNTCTVHVFSIQYYIYKPLLMYTIMYIFQAVLRISNQAHWNKGHLGHFNLSQCMASTIYICNNNNYTYTYMYILLITSSCTQLFYLSQLLLLLLFLLLLFLLFQIVFVPINCAKDYTKGY